jgi:hypothetical protein
MADMEDWLWGGLDDGAIIICNTFAFAKHEPFETIADGNDKIIRRFYKIIK